MDWSTALPDWEQRILAGQSLVPCPPLFPDEANEALKIFRDLHIVDAPGCPTFGQTGEQWVFDFVAAIFGAFDNESGTRLINEFFLSVSKKNGKSTIAAGIMLTALLRNWRLSNELIIVAPTIKAAENSFKPAADMVRRNPELDASSGGMLHVRDHIRTIEHLHTKATLRVLAADTGTVAGNKAAFVLIDELWEFGSKSGADAMMRETAGGLVARPEGFIVSITTQSDKSPTGVFKAKLDYARGVRDGTIDDKHFLPVIYEFPKAMVDAEAFLDPANFGITNPHLSRTAWGKKWIQTELNKELSRGPETRNIFLAKHLNVEIGLNLRSDRWAGAEFWQANAEPLSLEDVIKRSEVVVVGIDGGGLDDLLGIAVLGREKETGNWLLWSHAWAHEIVKQRRKDITPKLLDLENEGSLTFVDLPGRDVTDVADIVMKIERAGLLAEDAAIGVDSFGVTDIVKELTARQIATERIVGIPQGWQLNGAIKTAERNLAGGTLKHSGYELMTWAVGNARIEPKGNAISITKQVSGNAKIDMLMAAFNCVVLMGKNPTATKPPIYELFLVA